MNKQIINQLAAREILDSRGNPTIEAEVLLADGSIGIASVPSGASTGSKEAVELRDGDSRYMGKGVSKAVKITNDQLAYLLVGKTASDFRNIDLELIQADGTPNKSNLGANTLLAISLANARAVANSNGISLYAQIGIWMDNPKQYMPVPMMNVINGGAHADNSIDIQEFMIQPVGLPNFHEALRAGVEIFHTLKGLLKEQGQTTSVGDEGGFAPNLPTSDAVLEVLAEAVVKAGYKLGEEVTFALDCAASELYHHHKYLLEGKELDSAAMVAYLERLCAQYPIVSIEDGLDENDQEGWKQLTRKLGKKIQLVGDDLFVTNTALLEQGIKDKMANAILIKLNQIGTLSETIDCITRAHKAGYSTVISHRSGETEDNFIADLAVGSGSKQIKTGSLCRSDRVAKYNQLLRINNGRLSLEYAGRSIL